MPYQRLLRFDIEPDIVRVLYKGRIVEDCRTGIGSLELEERRGYDWIKKELGGSITFWKTRMARMTRILLVYYEFTAQADKN